MGLAARLDFSTLTPMPRFNLVVPPALAETVVLPSPWLWMRLAPSSSTLSRALPPSRRVEAPGVATLAVCEVAGSPDSSPRRARRAPRSSSACIAMTCLLRTAWWPKTITRVFSRRATLDSSRKRTAAEEDSKVLTRPCLNRASPRVASCHSVDGAGRERTWLWVCSIFASGPSWASAGLGAAASTARGTARLARSRADRSGSRAAKGRTRALGERGLGRGSTVVSSVECLGEGALGGGREVGGASRVAGGRVDGLAGARGGGSGPRCRCRWAGWSAR